MKKIFVLFCLAFIILAGQSVHAQMGVFDATLNALLSVTQVEQLVKFGQMIENGSEQIFYLKNQFETMGENLKMTVDNLSRIGEIGSWDDFMEWHNRQLYLEKKTEDSFTGMNISIGSKNYSLWDVEGIGYGIKETYVDYWDKEFNDEQRKEMWLGLGLTPSNYAYVQTWREREQSLARKFLTSSSIQNEEYIKGMTRNNEFLKKLAGDADRDIDDKIGEKELAAMNVEMSIHNNKALNDLIMMASDLMEMKAVEMYQAQTPIDRPVLSEWPDDVFGSF